MVRLTRELLERARASINPMKERELDLRGMCYTVRLACWFPLLAAWSAVPCGFCLALPPSASVTSCRLQDPTY
jgi:hypothetical protein